MMERELVTLASVEQAEAEQCIVLSRRPPGQNGTTYPNKRRLVITATSAEPFLIEIRPDVQQAVPHACAVHSTQCDMVQPCLRHRDHPSLGYENLREELSRILHDREKLQSREGSREEGEAMQDPLSDSEKEKEALTGLCTKAMASIRFLEAELKRKKERCDDHTLHAQITEMQTQILKQVEEIQRLQIENSTAESRILELQTKTKTDAERRREDFVQNSKLKSRVIDLEAQLAKGRNDQEKILADKEVECDCLRVKVGELEKIAGADECGSLRLKIEELEKEKEVDTTQLNVEDNEGFTKLRNLNLVQYQKWKASLSTLIEGGSNNKLNYAALARERNNLLTELEKVNKSYNRTASKLRDNVTKRRRLEAESEGEKQQRSNLAAALYELEGEVDVTVAAIDSLQTSTLESVYALTTALHNFQEALEKAAVSSTLEAMKSSEENESENIESDVNSVDEQSPSIQNPEVMSSTELENLKGVAGAKTALLKLAAGKEKLAAEISTARVTIRRALKTYKRRARTAAGSEVATKLATAEAERDNIECNAKLLQEENTDLKEIKQKLGSELQGLKKETAELQEVVVSLREENRRLLKQEAKWESVSNCKQGRYQESLVVQEWEKKVQKLECECEKLRQEKKALVRERHRLEDAVERATAKGIKQSGANDDDRPKLQEELSRMTQDRNKLRKVKITLAIENVSLKESRAELRSKVDALEGECAKLRGEWREKVARLEEECEDLREWRKKAEALEAECADLRAGRMRAESLELECEGHLRSWQPGAAKLEEECRELHGSRVHHEEESGDLRALKERFSTFEMPECEAQLHEYKCKVASLESEIRSLHEFKRKAEAMESTECENPDGRSKLTVASDYDNVHDFDEKIAKLEEENSRLCRTHQAALDKQWDVLEADLKAFEAKVEELEKECEGVRRDHLSSMVENSELAREKERLHKLSNERKCSLEILEAAYECLQKEQARKEVERAKERNDYYASIKNLKRKVVELESTFSERLRQQAASNARCLAPKITQVNAGREPSVSLTRQEYEIVVAEKSVMLQERDSAHKKLCSAEVQILHLSANIECLRQELAAARANRQKQKKQDIDAEVLLAQDVVNLRSMLAAMEVEAAAAEDEKKKMLAAEASLRQELLRIREENDKLGAALEEAGRRSSLEHIHSAASSLKEQLSKAIKEKDALKEQMTKVVKEKAQLADVANERDGLIFALKEKIATAAYEKEEIVRSLKEASTKVAAEKAEVVSDLREQLAVVSKERDDVGEEKRNLTHEREILKTKLSLMGSDRASLMEKIALSQRERGNLQEACKKLEAEVRSGREKLAVAIQQNERLAAKNASTIELAKKLGEEIQAMRDVMAAAWKEKEMRSERARSEKCDALAATIESLNAKLEALEAQAELRREEFCEGKEGLTSKNSKSLIQKELAMKEQAAIESTEKQKVDNAHAQAA